MDIREHSHRHRLALALKWFSLAASCLSLLLPAHGAAPPIYATKAELLSASQALATATSIVSNNANAKIPITNGFGTANRLSNLTVVGFGSVPTAISNDQPVRLDMFNTNVTALATKLGTNNFATPTGPITFSWSGMNLTIGANALATTNDFATGALLSNTTAVGFFAVPTPGSNVHAVPYSLLQSYSNSLRITLSAGAGISLTNTGNTNYVIAATGGGSGTVTNWSTDIPGTLVTSPTLNPLLTVTNTDQLLAYLEGIRATNISGAGTIVVYITGSSVTVSNTAGGGGSPGGADTQVQFNDSGSFAGSTNFTFVQSNAMLYVASNLSIGEPGFREEQLVVRSLSNAYTDIAMTNDLYGVSVRLRIDPTYFYLQYAGFNVFYSDGSIMNAATFSGAHVGDGSGLTGYTLTSALAADSITPVADGTYTTGLGLTVNGTITVTKGIITAITEAQ